MVTTRARRDESSTTELVREAIDETKLLVRLEVALAKAELREELWALERSAVAFGVAAAAAIAGLSLVLVAVALAIGPTPEPALVIGLVLLVAAAIAAFVGVRRLPKQPLAATRRRLQTDVELLEEITA